MNEPQSWLNDSASKGATSRSLIIKLAAGIGVIGLVLVGYAYGPATANKKTAETEQSPLVVAQAPAPETQKTAPEPEAAEKTAEPAAAKPETQSAEKPAETPQPATADAAPAAAEKPAEEKLQTLVPEPETAEQAPLTAADFEKTDTQTAGTPAEPARAASETAEPAKAAQETASEPIKEAEQTASQPAAEPAQAASAPGPEATQAEAAAEKPAQEAAAPAEPQMTAEEIRKLTGKTLVEAPLAASLSGKNRDVAEALRELLATRIDRLLDRRDYRQPVEAFYRDRGFIPLWTTNGERSKLATETIHYLNGIEAHGMEPSDYPVPHFAAAEDPRWLAEAELRFTNSVLDYTRHARTGRFHFTRLTGDIHYNLEAPDANEVLNRIVNASDVVKALDSYQPSHPQYLALKAKLAEARKETGRKEIVRVPPGPTLRLDMNDPRVVALRKRLEIPGDKESSIYDADVEAAVIAFQKSAGLVADGLAGPATLGALNGPDDANKVETIAVNMERWRWLPRELGRNHVVVNIPDFRTTVVRSGRNIWSTRTITGRIGGRETPLISTAMKSITVNPTWNVPQSIIAKDYLPALQQDPGVMDRMGIRVEQNRDGTIRMYQPPSDRNALGRLRFNTPNQFLVYLHDTPDRALFNRDQRTFSAGCMRVQDPAKFAEVVLSMVLPNENYTQERVTRMYGPSEINIAFPNDLPVHITYQTAWVDDAGKLQMRRDVYGHDQRMIGVLNGANRQVADTAVPKPKATYSREELRMPDGVYYGAGLGGPPRNPLEDFFRSIFR